jgi:hypothetical protein
MYFQHIYQRSNLQRRERSCTLIALSAALTLAIPATANAQTCPPDRPACAPATTGGGGGSSGGGSVGVQVNPVKVINAVGGIFKKKKKPVDATTTQAAQQPTTTATTQPKIVFQSGTGVAAPKPRTITVQPKPRIVAQPTPIRVVKAAPKPPVRVAPKAIVRAAKVAVPLAAVAAGPIEPTPEIAAVAIETPIGTEQPPVEVATVAAEPVIADVVADLPTEPVKKGIPMWLYGLGALLAAAAAATVLKMRRGDNSKIPANLAVNCEVKMGESRVTAQSSPFVTPIPIT